MEHATVGNRQFGTPPPDVLVARVASRQYGIVTVAQLHAAGLDSSAIKRRVARGRLHRVGRGVYAVGHLGLSEEAQWMAAVLTAGEGAALSHFACAKLWQVYRYRVPVIDVVVPARRRPATAARIHRCTNLHPRDVTVHKGIAVTTIPRLLVDLTDEVTKWELANVIHEAAFRDRFDLDATWKARHRANGRHRIKRLEEAIAMHLAGSAGARSRGELRLLAALEEHRLAEPLVNTPLHGYEVDFHWPALGLAIELDGPHHRRARTQAEDAKKAAAWTSGGFEVLRFDEADLRGAVAAVARRGGS